MQKIQLKILDPRLGKEIALPEYATDGSAGMDLRAALEETTEIKAGETLLIPTGLSIYVEDPNMAVNISIDDVTPKRQKDTRESPKVIQHDRKYVHDTVAHVESEGERYVLNGDSIKTTLWFLNALLLSNFFDLCNDEIMTGLSRAISVTQ